MATLRKIIKYRLSPLHIKTLIEINNLLDRRGEKKVIIVALESLENI